MAERVTQKKGKQPAVPPRQRGRNAAAQGKRPGTAQIAALEHERDELKARLAEAQAAIAKLELARDQALNHIDWTLDSLHNLLESDA